MLTATQATSIAATLKYFDQSLATGDYYMKDSVIAGTWHGKGAEILGLGEGSEATREQFAAILHAEHPLGGERLAQRIRKDRRAAIDLTFSGPKSFSLAHAFLNDEELLRVFQEAVHETMKRDVEPLIARRVRHGKHVSTQQRKTTGNCIYASFTHFTARPIAGKVDPHLHQHVVIPNWTFDDGKHYAAEMEAIFRQRYSLQAKFEARLARKLSRRLGIAVEKTSYIQSGKRKEGWELTGIERSTIEKFSSRTQQIEALAKERGIDDASSKAQLGVKVREKKDEGQTLAELRRQWRSQLTPQEIAAFEALRGGAIGEEGGDGDQATKNSVEYALQHHLYRQATVEKHVVVGTALEHGLTLLPEEIEAALQADHIIHQSHDISGEDRSFVTTREVLEAETRMIEFAREGRGTRMAIGRTEHVFERDWLNDQQKEAVRHVLNSRDTVTAIIGAAGTGKSSLMEEAATAIRSNGKEVFVFAPSTGAREVLEEKGFSNAQTVEYLLRNEKLQQEVKNQVLWIDEAGLLDTRSMSGIFAVAKAQNARVVLSGDNRQFASPRRGEAFRTLEQEAGLNIARVEKIQRQKGQYKQAIELLGKGNTVVDQQTGMTGMLAGFSMLDRMGKIVEIPNEKRHEVLANKYLESNDNRQSVLVVAPTHAEGQLVTDHIREQLQKDGAIGTKSHEYVKLKSLNLSDAEKSQSTSFHGSGLVVQFHQNVKGGFKRGQRYRVVQADGEVALQPVQGGTRKKIPFEAASRFEVYTETHVSFAEGDKLRFSLGGKDGNGRRISNGRLDEVKKFDKQGNIHLKSGLVIPQDYGHLDLGYVLTGHASQGKDKGTVIAAIGSQSLAAVNSKQLYVIASRGRDDCLIYVDNKDAIRRKIQDAGEQLSATELVHGKTSRQQKLAVAQSYRRRAFMDRVRNWWQARAALRETTANQSRPTLQSMQSVPQLSRG